MLRSRISPYRLALSAALAAALPAVVVGGACSATGGGANGGNAGNGGSGNGGSGNGGGSGGAAGGSAGAGGGTGGLIIFDDAGDDAPPDVFMNPCGTGCGPIELCDDQHLGLDDNCNGEVDEGCPCSSGQAHACFKGDSSYHNTPGCFDGTMSCTENGDWGPCLGGVHAFGDLCFNGSGNLCHPISTSPFVPIDLKDGTGSFSADAVTESWSVACPPGVNPCPLVTGLNPADDYKPLQSGEYTVTYTKTLANNSTAQCTYPVFVGSKGLGVELEWEHDLGGSGVDLDLYVHKPQNTAVWNIGGDQSSCGYANCKVGAFDPPSWFNGVAPPDPVEWYLDPVFEGNTCYFSPRGAGADWQAEGMGCRNPRLDLDNITCDPSISDVEDYSFCAPENINIDYPPKKQWMRVAVHYYSSHSEGYDVHPRVKIFCGGALAAELGSKIDPATGDLVGTGFYDPQLPVTFTPSDGSGFSGNRFWMVADVAFVDDQCALTPCIVKPLYSDPVTQTPIIPLDTAAEANFGPAYPPPLP